MNHSRTDSGGAHTLSHNRRVALGAYVSATQGGDAAGRTSLGRAQVDEQDLIIAVVYGLVEAGL